MSFDRANVQAIYLTIMQNRECTTERHVHDAIDDLLNDRGMKEAHSEVVRLIGKIPLESLLLGIVKAQATLIDHMQEEIDQLRSDMCRIDDLEDRVFRIE